MNQHEARLFSQLVEVNWKIDHENYDVIIKQALITHYHHLVEQLEDSMGRSEYRNYINGMRKMFAPAGGYGDESPEEVERMYASI